MSTVQISGHGFLGPAALLFLFGEVDLADEDALCCDSRNTIYAVSASLAVTYGGP